MEKLTDTTIKAFLEDAPIYTWKTYSQPNTMRASLWIKEIDEYCEVCEKIRPFQDLRSSGGGAGHPMAKKVYLESGTTYLSYTCATCRREKHEFLIEQKVSEETVKVQKYGQLPRKKLERDATLQKFFKADADYYEKAIISISNGYGIAAFAYFRRIVELNINSLLDLIVEDLDPGDTDNPLKKAMDELRKESPMSDKITIANNALPEHLKPDGLNPLGRIYGILSDGIHSFTDSECLEKAEIIQACLMFLVTELATRKRNREKFKTMVNKI